MEPKAMFGRRMIKTSVSEITSANLTEILREALNTHLVNQSEIDYLYKYYKGDQPILYREKIVRPEINNKTVENHAFEIVSFKTGYVFGEPVQYVRRGNGEDSSEKIATLNEFMFLKEKTFYDRELAEWFNICGVGYRMVLPDDSKEPESPFDIDTLDPRHTFVVYNNGFGRKPIMGVQMIGLPQEKIRYCVYTPTMYYEVEENEIKLSKAHILGAIPIIEYPANSNRIGSFEMVLTLLDTMNNISSNRIDGIEQFVQAFIKFINCEIDTETFKSLREEGALMVKSPPGMVADVGIVSTELDQAQVQTLKNDIYQMILIICGMPDRNGASKTTGDTGQAVILRDGWSDAEARARDTELVFKKSEKQFLKLALTIAKDISGFDIKLADIEIKFTRNKTDSLLVKTQGMQNMLEAGINPQIVIATAGLFSDPEQVYLDSLEYLEKWKFVKPSNETGNQKPNPENANAGGEGNAGV